MSGAVEPGRAAMRQGCLDAAVGQRPAATQDVPERAQLPAWVSLTKGECLLLALALHRLARAQSHVCEQLALAPEDRR